MNVIIDTMISRIKTNDLLLWIITDVKIATKKDQKIKSFQKNASKIGV